jgi:signal transduction histidine kinase
LRVNDAARASRTSRAPALSRLGDRVLEATGAEDLARILTRELPAVLGVSRATLLLWNRKLDSFEALTGSETQISAFRPGATPVPGFMLSDGLVLETRQGGDGVLVPLMARSGLVGMLVLGPRSPQGGTRSPSSSGSRSGRRKRPLRPLEARLLSTLATRSALVLENGLYLKELVATERVAALGTMAGMLAHDLRTPMTVIRGYAEMLRDEAATDLLRDRAQAIVAMVDRLDRMTRETLDFARAGGQIARRPVDVSLMVDEVFGSLERELPGLTVLRRVDLPTAVTAALDTDKLRRAVFNIADNARDAMNGSGRLHVTAAIEDDPGKGSSRGRGVPARWLVLTLADEGPGVPRSIRDTVFDPFVTAGKKGGTGLGLAVSRRLVEDQGGAVDLLPRAATDARGATFRIRLPLPAI